MPISYKTGWYRLLWKEKIILLQQRIKPGFYGYDIWAITVRQFKPIIFNKVLILFSVGNFGKLEDSSVWSKSNLNERVDTKEPALWMFPIVRQRRDNWQAKTHFPIIRHAVSKRLFPRIRQCAPSKPSHSHFVTLMETNVAGWISYMMKCLVCDAL